MKITYIDTGGMTDKEMSLSLSVRFGFFGFRSPARCRRRNRRRLVAALLDFSASTPDTVQRSVSTTSPQATGKSRSTFVDATLALNERGKRFGICLELRGVPHHARPFRSRPLVHFLTISGAQDDRGKWFVGSWQVRALNLQRPTCPADGAIFCCPPYHEIEHGAQIAIDCIAIPAGLALVPSASHPGEILPQCLRRVRYFVPNRLFQSRRSQPKIRMHSFKICHCSNQSDWMECQLVA
jgi:hypothetical protein